MSLASGLPARAGVAWRTVTATPSRWRWTVLGIAALALLVRALVIAHTHGGSDLRNYVYFSRIALHGRDPFTPSAHGLFAPVFSNSPPLEFAVFALLLKVHDSPTTLRVVFALVDVAVIVLIGLASRQPKPWRAAFVCFY